MRICIINTGGTISSTGQPLAPMAADRFARAAQDLLGPALAHFGWAADDWDRLARATMAGHLLECGAQVTGG